MDLAGWTVFGGTIVIGMSAIVASFIRSGRSLVFVIVGILVIPLTYCFLADALVLRASWWEWPMLPIQMGIPIAAAYYMWKSAKVRRFFSRRPPES